MQAIDQLRKLEGRQVCVALADGSRMDDCRLVSAGRGQAKTVWLFVNGIDAFLQRADVMAIWEASRPRQRSAA